MSHPQGRRGTKEKSPLQMMDLWKDLCVYSRQKRNPGELVCGPKAKKESSVGCGISKTHSHVLIFLKQTVRKKQVTGTGTSDMSFTQT